MMQNQAQCSDKCSCVGCANKTLGAPVAKQEDRHRDRPAKRAHKAARRVCVELPLAPIGIPEEVQSHICG